MADPSHSPKRRRLNDSRASTPRNYHDETPSFQPRPRDPHRNEPKKPFTGPEPDIDQADVNALDRDWYNTAEDGAALGD
ncbi:hypothetical protein LTR95_010546, partial [Oleoguttula sp. CCFEE 5521]